MEYNPVINGTDLAAAHTALRTADALRQEQADNFAWLALPLSDMCCARKEKKEMAEQAAEKAGREPASMLYVCTEGEAA